MSYETLADLDARFRSGLSERSTRFFTPTDVAAWLNEAQDFMAAEELLIVRGQWRLQSVKNAYLYLLPEACLAPEALYPRNSAGQAYRLDFMEGDEIDRISYLGRRASATSQIRWVTTRRVAEGLAMEMYPATSTWFPMVVAGARRMTKLVNSTDRTECPPGLTHVLVHYALKFAKFKDEEIVQFAAMERTVARDVLELRGRRMREAAMDTNPRARARRAIGRLWPR